MFAVQLVTSVSGLSWLIDFTVLLSLLKSDGPDGPDESEFGSHG